MRTSSSMLVDQLVAHLEDELPVLVVAARQRLLLQELVDGDVVHQLLQLVEHRERRQALRTAVLCAAFMSSSFISRGEAPVRPS